MGLLAAAAVCLLALPNLQAADAPADMTLSVPEGAEATQAPVDFSHTKHSAVECTTCHHKWDETGDPQSCSDSGCHNNLEAKRGDDSFYMAFHDRRSEQSCIGCHSAKGKAGEATGPKSCTKCHPK
jgi:hypothetical protein